MLRMRIITSSTNRVRFGIYTKCSRGYYLAKQSLQLYKEHGLKLLLCLVVNKLARQCISCLYRIRLPKPREGFLLREVLGSKMYLDLADEGISRDLIMDGIRERMSVEIVKREVKKGDIVVDIGANIGYYVLLEAQLIGDTGKIYAIEPVPSNYELLRKNIQINGYSNIESYQFAIGDAHGFHPIVLSTHRNKPTLRDVAGTNKEKYMTGKTMVEVVTLDDFLKNKPYPNMIRMDVEGYEYQIIRGMKNTLQRKLPLTLCIEFHFHLLRKRESTEILETLMSTGFQIVDVAIEAGPRGRHQHKLLLKVLRLVEPVIGKELNRRPGECHINLSINDILSNPAILGAQWGALQICFKRY